MKRLFKAILFANIFFYICTSISSDPLLPGGKTSNEVENKNSFSLVARNLGDNLKINFLVGNALFERIWEDAKSSENIARDGLGPFFSARSCEACHISDGRGHLPIDESDDSVSVVIQISKNQDSISDGIKNLPDPIYGNQISEFSVESIPREADIVINYEYVPISYNDGRIVELRKPAIKIRNFNYGDINEDTNFSARIAQPMIGLGLIENISETDILINADVNDINGDGISGKANIVWHNEKNDYSLGRFGWKASQPTVYQQTADAFFHDMGLSNKLFEKPFNCTDVQLSCQNAVSGNSESYDGYEVSNDQLDLVVFYSSQLGVPVRRNVKDINVVKGKEIFFKIGCNSCHTERFITKNESTHQNLANQIIYPYSDFLLHDMGEQLSDGVYEFNASGSEWRTPPLWGIGLTSVVSAEYGFLHDGRARTIEEAILWHGGEASRVLEEFKYLDKNQVNQLISFVNSL